MIICEDCGNNCKQHSELRKCSLCYLLSAEPEDTFSKEDIEILRKSDANQFLEFIESMNFYDNDVLALLREMVAVVKRYLAVKSSLTEGGLLDGRA